MTTTVVALFASEDAGDAAVKDLRDSGIDPKQISVVTSKVTQTELTDAPMFETTGEIAGAGAVTGTVFGGALGLLVGIGALAIPGIGPVLAAGPIITAIGAAAAGAGIGAGIGGLTGGLVSVGIPQEDAEAYAEGVRRGDTLVMVNVNDGAIAPVRTILGWHNPSSVEQHVAELRADGWSTFDSHAGPYAGDAIATYRAMTRDSAASESAPAPNDAAATHIRTYTASAAAEAPADTSPAAQTVAVQAATSPAAPAVEQPAEPAAPVTTPATIDDRLHEHYARTFASSGKPYESYSLVYRYGERLGHDTHYRLMDWDALEPIARQEWERNNPATWDDIHEAVQYAWDAARGAR